MPGHVRSRQHPATVSARLPCCDVYTGSLLVLQTPLVRLPDASEFGATPPVPRDVALAYLLPTLTPRHPPMLRLTTTADLSVVLEVGLGPHLHSTFVAPESHLLPRFLVHPLNVDGEAPTGFANLVTTLVFASSYGFIVPVRNKPHFTGFDPYTSSSVSPCLWQTAHSRTAGTEHSWLCST